MSLEQKIRDRRNLVKKQIHTSMTSSIDKIDIIEVSARQILQDGPKSITKAQAIAVLHILDRDELVKGKPGAEGEIREWGGKKYKKVGKEWKDVGKGGDGKKEDVKKDDKAKPSQSGDGGVDKHEIAQLTHLKSVMDENPDKAYEIYQSLSPEAQAAVPQEVVDKLVANSHTEKEDDAKKVFNDDEFNDKEVQDFIDKYVDDQVMDGEYNEQELKEAIHDAFLTADKKGDLKGQELKQAVEIAVQDIEIDNYKSVSPEEKKKQEYEDFKEMGQDKLYETLGMSQAEYISELTSMKADLDVTEKKTAKKAKNKKAVDVLKSKKKEVKKTSKQDFGEVGNNRKKSTGKAETKVKSDRLVKKDTVKKSLNILLN